METPATPIKVSPKKPKIKLDFKDSKYATGRRKKSIAKIWVKKGTGKIYAGEEHPHAAQNPKLLDLGKLNSKNLIRN